LHRNNQLSEDTWV